MVEHLQADGEEPCVTLDAFLEQSNATAVRLESDEDARALIPFLDRLKLIEVAFPKFRDGRGYSSARILREAGFTATDWASALYVPPFERKLFVKWATGFERVGAKVSSRLGGVIIVEAKKELLAPVATRDRMRARLGSLVPAQSAGGRLRRTSKDD